MNKIIDKMIAFILFWLLFKNMYYSGLFVLHLYYFGRRSIYQWTMHRIRVVGVGGVWLLFRFLKENWDENDFQLNVIYTIICSFYVHLSLISKLLESSICARFIGSAWSNSRFKDWTMIFEAYLWKGLFSSTWINLPI